jgi:hypothetical protein
MTIIYDMASGSEYLDEELSFTRPAVIHTPTEPLNGDERRVELRLALPEPTPPALAASTFPAGLGIQELINKIED